MHHNTFIHTNNTSEEYSSKHTNEEFEPITVLNCILELFDLRFVKFKLTNNSFVHILC